MAIKLCKRRHKMTGSNVLKQTNSYKRLDGLTSKYVVRVCVACRKFRAKKLATSEPFIDLRFSRRR